MAAGVGIDSGTRTTRVVRLVRKGDRVRWGGAVSVPQTPLAPADAPAGENAPTAELPRADALRARLREAGIRPRGAVAGLAGKDVIIRYSRVPPRLWPRSENAAYPEALTFSGVLGVSLGCLVLEMCLRRGTRRSQPGRG